MMTVERRLAVTANLFSIPRGQFITTSEGKNLRQTQVDVSVASPRGWRFRLGYWHGNTFIRENPVCRALGRRGIETGEGAVSMDSEPQYDMCFIFDDSGNLLHVSDQRSSMEAMS